MEKLKHKILFNTKGQSGLEYAIFIAMALLCFSMLFIFRSSFAGKVRANIDTIGQGEQYEP